MIVMLMFAPTADTEQMFRFEKFQNFRDSLCFPDQWQRIRRRCRVIKQIAPFECQAVRIKTIGVCFRKSTVILTVFGKIRNKKLAVMLLFRVRNITPMIWRRVFVCFKQRNDQFDIFYFRNLLLDINGLSHRFE